MTKVQNYPDQRNVFDSLMGVVSASDRKDFSATWELETQNVAQGVFMVETYDSAIGCPAA
jgi:hypothetical protein